MHRSTRVLFILLLIGMFASMQLAFTQAGFSIHNESYLRSDEGSFWGESLCLPGLYMVDPGACLPYGASQSIATLSAMGFPYPMRDLPAASPDPKLSQIPVLIAKINLAEDEPAPLYASFEDAIAGSNPVRYLNAGGLRYVSYVYRRDHNGKPYLQLSSGEWLRAAPAAYTDFQGLVFFENPKYDFGWIVDQATSFTAPSFSAAQTGNIYKREDVVQIYSTSDAEGVMWYLIGPNEWVNSLKARRVHFNPIPPETIYTERWITINLFEQTLVVYDQGQLLFATIIASGMEPFFTQPGTFQIYKKLPLETMQGAFEVDRSDYYYLQDVPWTMYFDQSRALHGSYWRTFFGYPQSHGCVNLSPGDANWLFQWAEEGDWVYVYDPSGQTPSDPDYYGPGAP